MILRSLFIRRAADPEVVAYVFSAHLDDDEAMGTWDEDVKAVLEATEGLLDHRVVDVELSDKALYRKFLPPTISGGIDGLGVTNR